MSIKSEQGSSMIIVVFIMVILSVAGAAVSYIANQSSQGIESVYQQAQATSLSKAALEFTVADIVENKVCNTGQPLFPDSEDYDVEVNCTAGEASYLEATHTGCDALEIGQDCYFHVTAATALKGSEIVIQRSLQAEVFIVALAEEGCSGNSSQNNGNNCNGNGNNTGGDTGDSSGSNGKGAGSGQNNGFGSGDQVAPGNSGDKNGAENNGGSN